MPRYLSLCLYVCSQFTSFLDPAERALAAEGFATARLDGRTSAKRRGDILRSFQSGAVQRGTAQCSAVQYNAGAGLC